MYTFPSQYEEFLNRASRLENSVFWNWLISKKGQVDFSKIDLRNWIDREGLNQDAFEAFCLNLRLLIQDKDQFSIRVIAKESQSWSDKHSAEKEGIRKAAQELEVELNKPSIICITPGKPATNEELFGVIFYGGIVHSNPEKRATYKLLVESGLFSYFVFTAFTGTLFLFRNCIQKVGHHLARFMVHEYGDNALLQKMQIGRDSNNPLR